MTSGTVDIPRSFEGRSLHTNVDTVGDAYFSLFGNGSGFLDEVEVIGFVHIGEARTRGEVLAAQWMLREQVDMVSNNH